MVTIRGLVVAVLVVVTEFLLAASLAPVLADTSVVSVQPEVVQLQNGGSDTTYLLPDGSVMTVFTPPQGFSPLTADNATLTALGFPERPAEGQGLTEWTTAMSAYRSDPPPTGSLSFTTDTSPSPLVSGQPSNWAGYIAGTTGIHSHAYVADKGVFAVPSDLSSCQTTDPTSFWIGLGGTYSNNTLVQQGVECGDTTDLGTPASAWKAFLEFANTETPKFFCGYNWTLAGGDVVYQNMSFQTSSNTAYFYLEDETSGITHSCAKTPPPGWSWDLNSAEWVGEGASPQFEAIDFGQVAFSDAMVQLDSNSTWVTLGSQIHTETYDGLNSNFYCIAPGAIGSNQDSFTDYWHQLECQ
jgi:hypothetical protein